MQAYGDRRDSQRWRGLGVDTKARKKYADARTATTAAEDKQKQAKAQAVTDFKKSGFNWDNTVSVAKSHLAKWKLGSAEKKEKKALQGLGEANAKLPKAPLPEAPTTALTEKQTAWFTQTAIDEGHTPEEAAAFLNSPQAQGASDIPPTEQSWQQKFIKTGLDAGYSRKALDLVIANEGNPETVDYINNKLAENYSVESIEQSIAHDREQVRLREASDLATSYNNIHSRYSHFAVGVAGLFNESIARRANQDSQELSKGIVSKLTSMGYQVRNDEDGRLMLMSEKGDIEREVTIDMLDSLLAAQSEFTTMAGTAALFASRVPPVGPLPVVAGARLVAGTIGAVVGAFAGSGADYVRNSFILKDELDAKVALSKMVDAGVAEAFFGSALGPAWRLSAALTNQFIKHGGHAYRFIKDGDVKNSLRVMKHDMGLNDAQMAEVRRATLEAQGGYNPDNYQIRAWGRIREMTEDEQNIAILGQHTPFGAEFVAGARQVVGGNELAFAINARAKALRRENQKLTPGEIPPVEEVEMVLKARRDDIESYYGAVVDEGANLINSKGDVFDLHGVTDLPAMDEVARYMDDPSEIARFEKRIEKMENLDGTRAFSDLLYLKKVVNRYKDQATETNIQNALGASIDAIEAQISKTARRHMPPAQAEEWLRNWERANVEWHELKILEKNHIYNEIVDKGATQESIIKTLENTAPALNDKFIDIMRILPESSKAKVEGAVLQMLSERYTVGKASHIEAVDFPQLAAKLKEYPFTTPNAKSYVEAVDSLGEILQSEIESAVRSGVVVPKDQSFLAKTVVARAEMQLVTSVWKIIKLFRTNQGVDRKTTIRILSRMIGNPANVKITEEFIKSVPIQHQPELRDITRQFMIDLAESGSPKMNRQSNFDDGGEFVSNKIPNDEQVLESSPEIDDLISGLEESWMDKGLSKKTNWADLGDKVENVEQHNKATDNFMKQGVEKPKPKAERKLPFDEAVDNWEKNLTWEDPDLIISLNSLKKDKIVGKHITLHTLTAKQIRSFKARGFKGIEDGTGDVRMFDEPKSKSKSKPKPKVKMDKATGKFMETGTGKAKPKPKVKPKVKPKRKAKPRARINKDTGNWMELGLGKKPK